MQPPQGEGQAPPPNADKNTQHMEGKENDNETNGGTMEYSRRQGKDTKAEEKGRASSSTCKPIETHKPKVEFPSHRINARIQYMRDHALIGKFIGIWPMEKVLRSLISAKWHPKGHISLHLGAKGFFTAVFNCLEDRNRIIDGGPYFFNSAGLYLKAWVEIFNPDKEDLTCAPVWIRLYSLPSEYWEEKSLQEIGNALGKYVKSAEETKSCRYTSYARICVYMDLKQPLPDTVSFFHEDSEWIQVIYYEHVPFRCRKCHDIGNLYRDCPQNKKPLSQDSSDNQNIDGFTRVTNRRRGKKKATGNPKANPGNKTMPTTNNNFEVLSNNDEKDLEKDRQKGKEADQEQPRETSGHPGKEIQK